MDGQSLTQQVADASDCRERVMDSLFFVGAYTLYNPLPSWSQEDALRARQDRLVACLRARGYGLSSDTASPTRP